jgi:hypothetical protein
MANFIDITGETFNDWTVLYRVKNDKYGQSMWLCECKCGNNGIITGKNLRYGKSSMCRECAVKKRTIHGKWNSRIYRIFNNMYQRCYNLKNKDYENYGGRFIRICPEWLNNRKSFIDWAMDNGYKDNLTIDRIDNNGNYEPSNCRWVTRKINNRNNRTTILNEEQVKDIKFALYKGVKNYHLAKLYNVNSRTISNIKTNKTWIDVKFTVKASGVGV